MDVSKLPKLSQSPPPPPEGAEPPPSPPLPPGQQPYVRPEPAAPALPPRSTMAEIWISVGIGVILLLLYPNTLKYYIAKATGGTPSIYADASRPAPAMADFILYTDGRKEFYRDRLDFWSDWVVTAFAIVLILDGIVPAITRKRGPLTFVMVLTLLTVLANLYYLFVTFNQGIALVSALAVVIGGYLLMLQWQRLGIGAPGVTQNKT